MHGSVAQYPQILFSEFLLGKGRWSGLLTTGLMHECLLGLAVRRSRQSCVSPVVRGALVTLSSRFDEKDFDAAFAETVDVVLWGCGVGNDEVNGFEVAYFAEAAAAEFGAVGEHDDFL